MSFAHDYVLYLALKCSLWYYFSTFYLRCPHCQRRPTFFPQNSLAFEGVCLSYLAPFYHLGNNKCKRKRANFKFVPGPVIEKQTLYINLKKSTLKRQRYINYCLESWFSWLTVLQKHQWDLQKMQTPSTSFQTCSTRISSLDLAWCFWSNLHWEWWPARQRTAAAANT